MLLYECDSCGACCKTFPIYASAQDAQREQRILLEARQREPWLATARQTYQLYPLPFLETCCFLDEENRCKIYATRPDVCREFEPGSEQCQEARRRQGLELLAATSRA
jgi:Fe-S-cluster containining protein